MKIYKLSYFVENAKGYLIDGNNQIMPVTETTHLDTVIEIYGLEDSIQTRYKSEFDEAIDWDKDWDWAAKYVYDYMEKNHIFCVIVDLKTKNVYIRPTNYGDRPSDSQIKALSDWAIENGYDENIIIDFVYARGFNKYKTGKKAIFKK